MKKAIAAVLAGTFSLCAAGWEIQSTKSKMDDSEELLILAKSSDLITAWPGTKFYPEISIQCSRHKVSLWLITSSSFSVESGNFEKATVRFRLDTGKPETRIMAESTDNHSVGTFDASFIRRVLAAKQITVEWTPFNSSPQVATVTLGDPAPAKAALLRACKMKV